MNSNHNFSPDWASPPGRTIRHILNEKNISVAQFRQITDLGLDSIKGLLTGVLPISAGIAATLEKVLGGSASFWLEREAQYRGDLIRAEKRLTERREWVAKFPLQDIHRFGWLKPSRTLIEKESSLLSFFGVKSIEHWYEKYYDMNMEVSFRTSSTFDSVPEAVITWIRQCEIEGESLQCSPWNPAKFKQALDAIKPLTREKDPNKFLPEVQVILAKCGVALVVNPLPKRCHASGATYFKTPDKALMLMSFRYLSDDHFWFTFFHEAGHLLLHKKSRIFLETKDHTDMEEEKEANAFAANFLVPEEYQSELNSFAAKDWKKIIRFAKKIGVSPGIIVGQLQHSRSIRFDQLNKLKVRYKWNHKTSKTNH